MQMKIKRATALFIIFAMFFSFCPMVFAESKAQYGTLSVKWFSKDESELMTVMVKDDCVYAEASLLAEKFGYRFSSSGKKAAIINSSPLRVIAFQAGSKEITYVNGSVSNDALSFNYSMPSKAISNENGFWVPFVYVLRLLDSGYLLDTSYVTNPTKTLLSDFSDMTYRVQDYKFDVIQDLGDKKWRLYLCEFVTRLDGLLGLDPACLTHTTVDIKYTEQLAGLFCAQSKEEIRELAEEINRAYDVLSDSGEWNHLMKSIVQSSDVNLKDAANRLQTAKDSKITSSAEMAKLTKNYEKVNLNNKLLNGTSKVTNELQSNFQSSDNKSDYLAALTLVLNFYTYYQELENQDKISLDTMKSFTQYLNDNKPQYVSGAGAWDLKTYVNNSEFESGIIAKSVFNTLVNSMDSGIDLLSDLLSGGNVKEALFGASGALLLFAWDLASNYTPMLKIGLDNTDYSTLAIYSQALQNETERWYGDCLNTLYANPDDATVWSNYAKSAYAFLKMSYIARENGIAIANTYLDLNMYEEDDAKIVESYLTDLNKLNKKVIDKAAFYYTLSGDFYNNDSIAYFGMIPPVEAEVKKGYDKLDKQIIEKVENISDEYSVYTSVELSNEDKDDIAKLIEFNCDINYNSNDPSEENIALFLAISPLYGYWGNEEYPITKDKEEVFWSENSNIDASKDPLKVFPGSYSKYDGEAVDWLLKNILNFEPTHDTKPTPFVSPATSIETGEGLKKYYYDGNYYMEYPEGLGGLEGYGIVFDNVISDGRSYHIQYKRQYASWLADEGNDDDYPIQTAYATVKKNTVNGKEYWSVVRLSDTPYFDFSLYDTTQSEYKWKQLYIDHIKKNEKQGYLDTKYKLVYINNDDIPELIIDKGSFADGSEVCTVYNDKLSLLPVSSYGVSYIERQNIFINSGGHMDSYFDDVYKIDKGKFVKIAGGEFGLEDYSAFETYEGDITDLYTYYWNNKKVSETQYQDNLKKSFDNASASTAYQHAWTASTMIDRLNNDFLDVYPINTETLEA